MYFLEEFMSFVGYLSSINSSYYICGVFSIHVDVPVGDGHKFITFLDSCDLKQLVNKATHLQDHILDLILSPSDQDTIADVKICDFVSDHTLVKCSVAFPCQVAHSPHIVQYRRYHHINMSHFCLDLKNTSFVKSPADAVVDLCEQYVHDLGYVLDRHAPLISRQIKKIPQIGCLMIIDVQSPLGANLREAGIGLKIHRTEVSFVIRLLGATHL